MRVFNSIFGTSLSWFPAILLALVACGQLPQHTYSLECSSSSRSATGGDSTPGNNFSAKATVLTTRGRVTEIDVDEASLKFTVEESDGSMSLSGNLEATGSAQLSSDWLNLTLEYEYRPTLGFRSSAHCTGKRLDS